MSERRKKTLATILLDENLEGYASYLSRCLFGDAWSELSLSLDLQLITFAEAGLAKGATDETIWELCQKERLYLLTDNRNEDDIDSLGVMIRTRNLPTSFPVFTISDMNRFRSDRFYAEAAVARLLEYLASAENLPGTGRLYVP